MLELLWVTTTVTFFVLLAYSVEQLADTYDADIEQRIEDLEFIQSLDENYQ